MARAEKKIHYLYKTTCIITSRWYIGLHSTNNMDDGYMGSGKRLRYSIRKYGVDNHKKEILEFFETRELLVEAEIKAITTDMITDTDCMNIVDGGGGFTSEYAKICAIKSNEKQRFLRENNQEWVDNHKLKTSLGLKKAYDTGKREKKTPFDWTGKKHSEVTKELLSELKRGTGIGENNSQYGTCWITKDGTNKKIKKEDIETYLNEGWVKGKKVKSSIDESILLEIKELKESGISYNKLVVKFGIPKTTILNNLKRQVL